VATTKISDKERAIAAAESYLLRQGADYVRVVRGDQGAPVLSEESQAVIISNKGEDTVVTLVDFDVPFETLYLAEDESIDLLAWKYPEASSIDVIGITVIEPGDGTINSGKALLRHHRGVRIPS
jgi:hypothetical protein